MSEQQEEIHDVLIVGAGPSSLAVAARLCESTPSALFTDSEHQRYHWMKRSSNISKKNSKNSIYAKPQKVSRRSGTAADRLIPSTGISCGRCLKMTVLDACGDTWMESWNQRFAKLGIVHLRSPMFFHPDPGDRDALRGYVWRRGREGDLKEIRGVVGGELSKYQRKVKVRDSGKRRQETTYFDERDRNDFWRPSTAVFREFCEDVATRYDLQEIVQKSEVLNISWDPATLLSSDGNSDYDGKESGGLFTVTTSTGVKRARVVVFAVGSAMLKPDLPIDCPFYGKEGEGSVGHVFECNEDGIMGGFWESLPVSVRGKISRREDTNVVVVGGGLTSAQCVDMCVKLGVTKIWHFMRGPFKTKHFDVDLKWVGKYKNWQLASFWSADDDDERLQMIQEARNGGSITPEYKHKLTQHIKSGHLSLYTHTLITSATWNTETSTWTIQTNNPSINDLPLPPIDHVIYATGMPVDFKSIPCVKDLCSQQGIETIGGMPILTEDLMLKDELPFFVTGRLAGLKVGPWAGNLEGARMGAERVVGGIGEVFAKTGRTGFGGDGEEAGGDDSGFEDGEGVEGVVDMRRLGLGVGNQFSVLDGEGFGGESD